MLTFTVYEPPNPPPDRVDRAESLAFVKDGFGWAALLFAPLWLIAHRLWWALLGYVAANGLIEACRLVLPSFGEWPTLAVLALHLIIAFEAGVLRQWGLERRRWRAVGAVSGRTRSECERRFYEAWLPSQPMMAPVAPPHAGGGRGLAGPQRRIPVIGSLLGARS